MNLAVAQDVTLIVGFDALTDAAQSLVRDKLELVEAHPDDMSIADRASHNQRVLRGYEREAPPHHLRAADFNPDRIHVPVAVGRHPTSRPRRFARLLIPGRTDQDRLERAR